MERQTLKTMTKLQFDLVYIVFSRHKPEYLCQIMYDRGFGGTNGCPENKFFIYRPRTANKSYLYNVRINILAKAVLVLLFCLTHLCLASHKRDFGKQWRSTSDATERCVWSGSTLFAWNTVWFVLFVKKHDNTKTNQIPLRSVMDL